MRVYCFLRVHLGEEHRGYSLFFLLIFKVFLPSYGHVASVTAGDIRPPVEGEGEGFLVSFVGLRWLRGFCRFSASLLLIVFAATRGPFSITVGMLFFVG